MSLFLPLGVLLAASLLTLSSVALGSFYLQLVWIGLGLAVIALFYWYDWRPLLNNSWIVWAIYALGLALLLLTYFTGPVIRNIRGWLVLGPRNFQPVEFMKVALILVYARYFSRHHISIARWRHIGISLLYFALPAILVMLQPDLGSTLVLFGIWFGFLLVSGLPRRRLVVALLIFVIVAAGMWQYGLKDYQRARIIGTFYPERYTQGVNYSVIQSKIAIGSAGWFGKGYGQGTQTQLKFLTEPATDFIFPAFVEEWGWLAGAVVIISFLALTLRILKIGISADQNFEKLIAVGAAILFAWQFFLNIGSATGLVPVVGVTFPFLSYGGSSLLMSFGLLALVHAIALRS